MVGLGILTLIYRDFALFWQPVPAWVPGRAALACASGVLMGCCGLGLLLRPTSKLSAQILFPFFISWAIEVAVVAQNIPQKNSAAPNS
jgi:uncharacterized membrane protein